MDKYTLTLLNEILECEDLIKFDQLQHKVSKDIEDGQFDNDLDKVLLKIALLARSNNMVNSIFGDDGSGISIIIAGGEDLFSEDSEETRLKEMKEDDLNEIKQGMVYNIRSLEEERKKE